MPSMWEKNDFPSIVWKLYRFHLIVLPASARVVGDLEVLSSSMHYAQKCLQKTMTFMFIHARSELFVTVQYVLSQLKNNNIPTITSTVCCGCVQLIDVIAFSSVHSQLPSFQRERRAGRAHFCNYQNASVERISSRSRLSRIFSFHPCQITCEVWFGFLWLCFFGQFSCNLGHITVLVHTASVTSLCGGLKPPTVTLPPKN